MSAPASVVILSGVRGDTRRYRTFHPYEQLCLAGVDCLLSHITTPDLPARLERARLAIFHRTTFDPYVDRLIQSVQSRGGLCILDIDDLIFDSSAFHWIDSPDFVDPLRAALYQEDMRRHRLTLEACAAVMASTDYLAEQARRLGKPAWVHRNAFSHEMLALSQGVLQHGRRPQENGKVVIGYASGTPTHDRDFEVVRLTIQEVLQSHPETELWLVGPLNPGKDWGPLANRVKPHPFVPWRELPALLARFDINLAPLVMDNPFGQSKSEIKYMEAGLVQVPTIASPTGAYRFAIRHGENGFLAASQQEWTEALRRLVDRPDLRRATGESAYADVLQRYHPATRAAELLATLDQISRQFLSAPFEIPHLPARHIDEPGAIEASQDGFTVGPEVERTPTLAQMALYSLRYRGARTVLMQVWIYFRRLLAPIFPFRKRAIRKRDA
jgi:glycosyltransferase involved in cell wall biosynthesis